MMIPLRLLHCFRYPKLRTRHFTTTSHLSNESKKPFYITTPIFYPNAAPHIGHLYTLVAADVLARYQAQRGRQVNFLTGTDEHGMKLQKAANKHFGEPGRELEFCDLLSLRFKDLAAKANISNTCFVRTTSESHHKAVEDIWNRLYKKGYIYKSKYEGWYSVTDECFYTDAQIGPAPSSSENGEQLYVSLETGAAVEWFSEENYMFRLSAFRPALLSHILDSPTSIYPPQYRTQVLGWLGVDDNGADLVFDANSPGAEIVDRGLDDISISRPASRLSWGIPVPHDPSQTVYVWFDALLIYLSGAGYPWMTPGGSLDIDGMRRAGWPADVQVVGKDILRFHAIYLPAILLGLESSPYQNGEANVEWPLQMPLPRTLLTHAHWTADGRKMSKSIGNVVDPLAELDRWGVDGVRFYLMRVGGKWRTDADWSTDQLDKHLKELKAQLGNYFLRIASPRISARAIPPGQDAENGLPLDLQNLFLQTSSEATENIHPNYEQLRLTLALPARVAELMDNCEAGAALNEVMNLLKHANKSVSEIEPWLASTPAELVHTTRIVGLETLRVAGACLLPFIPEAASQLLRGLDNESGLVRAEEILSLATVEKNEDTDRGKKDMNAFWTRWNGREVGSIKLF